MTEIVFKRKAYDQMLLWKEKSQGKSDLLIEGARRIGKSTIAEQFAKNEYRSYLLLDFNKVPQKVKDLFEDLEDLDFKNKLRLIAFAIIDDHNAHRSHNPEGNYKPFAEEFA